MSVEEYVNNLCDTIEFKRLLELKKIIDDKYQNLIIKMKTAEARYLENVEFEKYRPEVKQIRREFVQAKSELYSKEEVKEYFELERKLQKMLNDDINELKEAISPHFTLTKSLFIDEI